MWYLFFIPNYRIILPSTLRLMKSHIEYPIIPRSSLKQFFQKLVLNMVCYKHTTVSTRNKLFTRSSQDYLSELWDRWDSSSDFAIPYYHICLETMRFGQTILMVSPPPREQLTRLWTIFPDDIYNYLGRQYDASIGEFVYESVHGRRWEDYRAFLLMNDPSNFMLHPSFEHLDWVSERTDPCYTALQSNSTDIFGFP